MKRRMGMAGSTGLGISTPDHLINNWPTERRTHSLVRRCLNDAVDKYFTKSYDFKGWGEPYVSAWCDFAVSEEELKIGQEPSYKFEDLKIVCISRKKDDSYIQTGRAVGYWGSEWQSKTKYYKDYKYNSKFVRFVDRWHKILYEENTHSF